MARSRKLSRRSLTVILSVVMLMGTVFLFTQWQLSASDAKSTGAALANAEKALAGAGLAKGLPVYIRIFKQDSELELWMERQGTWVLFKNFPICTWSGDLGPKLREGDRQSPEGFYRVTNRSLNPNSSYHLSFNLGFPNAYDRSHGRSGSFLMVHGACASVGCYAMTDPGIEVIYRLVEAALAAGQDQVPVHIFPFRMTDDNMKQYETARWAGFWQELKPAYDLFERYRRPPLIAVKGRRYKVSLGI